MIDLENELYYVQREQKELDGEMKKLRQREMELVNEIMAIEDDLGIRNYGCKTNRV